MGFFRHIQTTCSEVLQRKGNDVTLLFWRAYALGAEGSVSEAIRELEDVRQRRETEFPATCQLIYLHKKADVQDHSAIRELEGQLSGARSRANTRGLLLAGNFYCIVGQTEEARELAVRILRDEPNNTSALTLHGWVDLTAPQKTFHDKDIAQKSL
eukprot:g6241.t1